MSMPLKEKPKPTKEQRAAWNAAYRKRKKHREEMEMKKRAKLGPVKEEPKPIPVQTEERQEKKLEEKQWKEPIQQDLFIPIPETPNTKLQEPEPMYSTPQAVVAASNNPALNPALALVRCRINNLDPKKADLPGEIITVGNSEIGVVRKFIPFGEATDNGYHIPKIVYDFLKDRKFLNITTQRGKGKGETITVKQQWLPEFSLEVLPSLSKEELEELAQQQRASAE